MWAPYRKRDWGRKIPGTEERIRVSTPTQGVYKRVLHAKALFRNNVAFPTRFHSENASQNQKLLLNDS